MKLVFLQSGDFDPIIDGTVVQKILTFNVGASYNYLDFYAHGTVKNAIETRRDIYTEYESDNLRKYLLPVSYVLEILTEYYWSHPYYSNLLKKRKRSPLM
jgi:hypothetical protein